MFILKIKLYIFKYKQLYFKTINTLLNHVIFI